MTEFSDWGFGVEPVRGIRRWGLTPDGYLKGYFRDDYIWGDGEVEASCGLFRQPHTSAEGFQNCLCGFYGYHDGNPYPSRGVGGVVGVIEGYGSVVIGHNGFRCSKARILAICPPMTNHWDKFIHILMPAYLVFFSIYFFYLASAEDRWYYQIVGGIMMWFLGMDIYNFSRVYRKWKAIRRHYPDVKMFWSSKKMLEAFPLTSADQLYPGEDEVIEPRKFTCPKCGKNSYNPMDIQYGYCGKCHEFTGGAFPP